MSDKTIFEKIIAGEVSHHKVYEDEDTFAFLDADPVNPGHTLVIPKEPYENIYEIPEDAYHAVMETVRKLSPKVKEAVSADGINIGINNDPAAGQEVMHLHVHIMPRFTGDGFQHWQGDEPYHDNERGETVAEKIREVLTT